MIRFPSPHIIAAGPCLPAAGHIAAHASGGAPAAPALAADFTSANSEYLSHADHDDLSFSGDFTIGCWFYLNATGSAHALFGKWKFATNEREYLILYDGTRVEFRISGDGTAGTQLIKEWSTALSAETWYCAVCKHDDGATVSIEVNRATAESAAFTNGINAGGAEFRVGADVAGTYMDGRIGPCFGAPSLLSSDVLDEIYNSGAGAKFSDLAASTQALFKQSGGTNGDLWWDLGETSGDRASASGNFNLTDNNTVTSAAGVGG